MSRLSTIKARLLIVFLGISIIFCSLLAVYAPYRAKELGRAVLDKNMRFITSLLVENLSLCMQTMLLDNGESLQQTLNLLEQNEDSDEYAAVSRIRIFDGDRKYVAGLNSRGGDKSEVRTASEQMVAENDEEYYSLVSHVRFQRGTSWLRGTGLFKGFPEQAIGF